MDFSNPLIRFATSGLLIAFYGLVDHLSRRNGGELRRQGVRPPRALTIVVTCCVLAYYMMIRPYGGPLLGGLGNMIGGLVAAFIIA